MLIDAKVIPAWDTDFFVQANDAGLTAVNVPVALWDDHASTLTNLATLYSVVKQHPNELGMVTNADDFERFARSRTTGVIPSVSSSAAFSDSVTTLAELRDLGVLIAQPTFMAATALGSSCIDEIDDGLTGTGHEFVEACNALGVAIDLAHVGDRTAAEVIAATQAPVFYTQAAPRALNPAPRNKTDEAMRAAADTGGVISIAALRQYLPRRGESTITDMVAAITHCINVAGEEHVALGSDLTPDQGPEFYQYVARRYGTGDVRIHSSADDATPGFADACGYQNLIRELHEAGVRSHVVDNVMGRNLQRFFTSAWTST